MSHRQSGTDISLETLLAARDRLNLSYVGLDATKGEKLDASPVIKELEFVLKPYVGQAGVDALTHDPPLTAWQTPPPGDGSTTIATPCAGVAQLARQLPHLEPAAPTVSPVRTILESLGAFGPSFCEAADSSDQEIKAHVKIGHIRRFLQSPLQASAKDVLKLQTFEQRDAITREPTTQG